jgi:uncharacterized protein with PQ loop repeat
LASLSARCAAVRAPPCAHSLARSGCILCAPRHFAFVCVQVLGYVVVVGAIVVRLPQVWRMWRTRSCEGLNPLSHEAEMLAYVICVLNGLRLQLPVVAWGEMAFHSVFGIATTLMIYGYAKPGSGQVVSKTRKTIVLTAVAARTPHHTFSL